MSSLEGLTGGLTGPAAVGGFTSLLSGGAPSLPTGGIPNLPTGGLPGLSSLPTGNGLGVSDASDVSTGPTRPVKDVKQYAPSQKETSAAEDNATGQATNVANSAVPCKGGDVAVCSDTKTEP